MSNQGGYENTHRCKFWISHKCGKWVYMNGERCHGCIVLGRGTPEEVSNCMKTPENIQQVIEGSIPAFDHRQYVEYPDGSTGQRCIMYFTPKLCLNFTRNKGLIRSPALCDDCPEPPTTDYQTNINYYKCIYCSATGCSNWVWASGIPCSACESFRETILEDHRARIHSPVSLLLGDIVRRPKRRNEMPFQPHEAASQISHQRNFDKPHACPKNPALPEYAIEDTGLVDEMGKHVDEDRSESRMPSSISITQPILSSSDSSSAAATANYNQITSTSFMPQVDQQIDPQLPHYTNDPSPIGLVQPQITISVPATIILRSNLPPAPTRSNVQDAWAGWVAQIVNEIESANAQGGEL